MRVIATGAASGMQYCQFNGVPGYLLRRQRQAVARAIAAEEGTHGQNLDIALAIAVTTAASCLLRVVRTQVRF